MWSSHKRGLTSPSGQRLSCEACLSEGKNSGNPRGQPQRTVKGGTLLTGLGGVARLRRRNRLRRKPKVLGNLKGKTVPRTSWHQKKETAYLEGIKWVRKETMFWGGENCNYLVRTLGWEGRGHNTRGQKPENAFVNHAAHKGGKR